MELELETEAEDQRVSSSWKLALGSIVFLAASRAALVALKDGYFQAEAYDIAIASSFRHFGVGLCIVSTWSIGVAWLASRGHAQSIRMAILWCVATAALDYLFLTGRVPSLPFHAPAFDGVKAWGAHVLACIASIAASIAVVFARKFDARLANTCAALGGVIVLAISGARIWSASMGPAAVARPNVILISIDTVRADHVGSYGYKRPTTPAIDRFAEEAVRFEHAFCPQAWTLTSHMTLLASLYPVSHGVDTHRLLPPSVRTLASLLAEHGYRTAAQVDRVVWLEEKYGFARGFDVYRRVAGNADRKNAYAASLLDDLQGKPFFLLLHYFDAHSDFSTLPYEAAPRDEQAFTGDYHGSFTGCDERKRCASNYLRALNDERRQPTPEDLAYIEGLYDAGLSGLDRELGRLFDDLKARGLYDNSIIVLTADHGEEFGEHGMFLHEQAYDECLAVPLFIRLPGPAVARVASPVVGLIDVAPTLLDLCGIAPPAEMQGRSLKPLLLGDAPRFDREGLLIDWGDGAFGFRTSEWKLFDDGKRWHLYDLVRDGKEQRDVHDSAENAATVTRLSQTLAVERERALAAKARLGAGAPRTTLSEAELSELRGLGYAGK